MTLAWYGHIHWKNKLSILEKSGIWGIVFLSWGIALFEYIFQVPANKIGHQSNGGPFNMFQLKTIQETISILVFVFFYIYIFKEGDLRWNHLLGLGLLISGVFFIFKN